MTSFYDLAHAHIMHAIEAEAQAERYAVALMQAEAHGDVETHLNHLADLALHYALTAGTQRRIAEMYAATYTEAEEITQARMLIWERVRMSIAI